MNDPQEIRTVSLGKMEWGVIVALFMSITSSVFTFGILWNQVQDLDRRTGAIEGENRDTVRKLAAIEANTNFLVNRARDEDNRRK
jgi:hypothetical protein